MTLPEAITEALPPDDRLRIGVIASVAPVVVNVQGTLMPGHALGSYAPVIGDSVAVLRQDQTWLIFGKTSSDGVGTTGPTYQAGSVSMTVAAVTSATTALTFARPFTRVPAVSGNINSGAGATANWHARAINVTTTGFTMFIFGPSASFTAEMQWQAQEYTQ